MHRQLVAVSIVLSAAAANALAVPTADEVVQAASLLGLSPQSLAAVDVFGNEVATLLDRISEEYDQVEAWLTADRSHAAALCDARDARAILRVNPEDQEARALLDRSLTGVQAASDTMQQARASLISELLDGLADSSAVFQVIHTNAESCKLPPVYRLAADTSDDAKTLCWAVKLEDRIGRMNDPEIVLPRAAQDAINAAEAQTDFQLGRARVQAHAAANQAAIDQWVRID